MSDKYKRFYVFNATDGILANTRALTLAKANDFIARFPKRFETQGYYLTAQRERISPDSVELNLIDAEGEEGRRLMQTDVECE